MGLREKLEPYFQPIYRVVSLYRPKSLGEAEIANYHLVTAHTISLAHRTGNYKTAGELCDSALKFIALCEVERGLIARYPGNRRETSWDEMMAAARNAWSAGVPSIAKDMLLFGLETDDTWDIESPKVWRFQYWMARNLMFKPMLRACATLRVGYASQIFWSLGLLLSLLTPKSNTNGKQLCDFQLDPMLHATKDDKHKIVAIAVGVWLWRMGKQYPKGRREFFSIFLPADHPTATEQREDWK